MCGIALHEYSYFNGSDLQKKMCSQYLCYIKLTFLTNILIRETLHNLVKNLLSLIHPYSN